jgi:hypothetical protein
MPRPSPSKEAYADIMPYLDIASEHGYVKLDCQTEGQAISAVQRMNKWRLIERDKGIYYWDSFIFSRTGRVVEIKPRERLKVISVTDLDGNPINVDDKPFTSKLEL